MTQYFVGFLFLLSILLLFIGNKNDVSNDDIRIRAEKEKAIKILAEAREKEQIELAHIRLELMKELINDKSNNS